MTMPKLVSPSLYYCYIFVVPVGVHKYFRDTKLKPFLAAQDLVLM